MSTIVRGESQAEALRVGIAADLLEERWPSMDLVAEMVGRYVPVCDAAIAVETLRPPFVRRLGRIVRPGTRGEWTRDRVLNRFWDYPRWLRARARHYDVLHVIDHSYAHLARATGRTPAVVTVHDLDAFRTLLGQPGGGGLPAALVRRLAAGLRLARVVVCVSQAVRDELISSGLVPSERIRVVTNGVHPSCSHVPHADADAVIATRLGPVGRRLELLHVGSVISRKRIDVLLGVLAGVAAVHPDVVLLRVGGALTAAQRADAVRLGVGDRIVELPPLDRSALAAVYRRAALVLLPSEREGFGLPLVEALACGTPVLASELPVLREVGAEAVTFAPVGDVPTWIARTLALLAERRHPARWDERRLRGRLRADTYGWEASGAAYAALYREVAGMRATTRGAVA
jgi:glycosyltransferase involved in cell wall biosynthesis